MASLLFEQNVKSNKEKFVDTVRIISSELGINPNWLMGVMQKESGLDHQAVNAKSGATGLIQFMPATARGLGTSPEALKLMSNVDQLHYVKKYFAPYRYKIHSYKDMYLATFFPLALGKSDDWVIQSKGLSAETIAKANSVIDLDKNGRITVGEFARYCFVGFPANIVEILKKKLPCEPLAS